jgi:hypothetical protein
MYALWLPEVMGLLGQQLVTEKLIVNNDTPLNLCVETIEYDTSSKTTISSPFSAEKRSFPVTIQVIDCFANIPILVSNAMDLFKQMTLKSL